MVGSRRTASSPVGRQSSCPILRQARGAAGAGGAIAARRGSAASVAAAGIDFRLRNGLKSKASSPSDLQLQEVNGNTDAPANGSQDGLGLNLEQVLTSLRYARAEGLSEHAGGSGTHNVSCSTVGTRPLHGVSHCALCHTLLRLYVGRERFDSFTLATTYPLPSETFAERLAAMQMNEEDEAAVTSSLCKYHGLNKRRYELWMHRHSAIRRCTVEGDLRAVGSVETINNDIDMIDAKLKKVSPEFVETFGSYLKLLQQDYRNSLCNAWSKQAQVLMEERQKEIQDVNAQIQQIAGDRKYSLAEAVNRCHGNAREDFNRQQQRRDARKLMTSLINASHRSNDGGNHHMQEVITKEKAKRSRLTHEAEVHAARRRNNMQIIRDREMDIWIGKMDQLQTLQRLEASKERELWLSRVDTALRRVDEDHMIEHRQCISRLARHVVALDNLRGQHARVRSVAPTGSTGGAPELESFIRAVLRSEKSDQLGKDSETLATPPGEATVPTGDYDNFGSNALTGLTLSGPTTGSGNEACTVELLSFAQFLGGRFPTLRMAFSAMDLTRSGRVSCFELDMWLRNNLYPGDARQLLRDLAPGSRGCVELEDLRPLTAGFLTGGLQAGRPRGVFAAALTAGLLSRAAVRSQQELLEAYGVCMRVTRRTLEFLTPDQWLVCEDPLDVTMPPDQEGNIAALAAGPSVLTASSAGHVPSAEPACGRTPPRRPSIADQLTQASSKHIRKLNLAQLPQTTFGTPRSAPPPKSAVGRSSSVSTLYSGRPSTRPRGKAVPLQVRNPSCFGQSYVGAGSARVENEAVAGMESEGRCTESTTASSSVQQGSYEAVAEANCVRDGVVASDEQSLHTTQCMHTTQDVADLLGSRCSTALPSAPLSRCPSAPQLSLPSNIAQLARVATAGSGELDSGSPQHLGTTDAGSYIPADSLPPPGAPAAPYPAPQGLSAQFDGSLAMSVSSRATLPPRVAGLRDVGGSVPAAARATAAAAATAATTIASHAGPLPEDSSQGLAWSTLSHNARSALGSDVSAPVEPAGAFKEAASSTSVGAYAAADGAHTAQTGALAPSPRQQQQRSTPSSLQHVVVKTPASSVMAQRSPSREPLRSRSAAPQRTTGSSRGDGGHHVHFSRSLDFQSMAATPPSAGSVGFQAAHGPQASASARSLTPPATSQSRSYHSARPLSVPLATPMHGEAPRDQAQLLPNHRLNRSASASSPMRGWHDAVHTGAVSPAPSHMRTFSPMPQQQFQPFPAIGPLPAMMPLPHPGPNALMVAPALIGPPPMWPGNSRPHSPTGWGAGTWY